MRDLIKTIGLFRTKAKNVVELSRRLVADHGGQVPRAREALEALPGVGRKTANVVLNIAFGEPTIAVDTHIFRVGNRTGLAPGKNPLEVEQKLEAAVPARYKLHAHHWLILHGRYTCLARKPLCEKCIIADLCQWPEKTVRISAAEGDWDGRLCRLRRRVEMFGEHERHSCKHAGLPPQRRGNVDSMRAVAFQRQLQTRHRRRHSKFWRGGTDLLAKLPKKPQRTPTATDGGRFHSERLAATAREDFLAAPCRKRLSQAH